MTSLISLRLTVARKFTFCCFSAGFEDILSHIFGGGGGGLFGGKELFYEVLTLLLTLFGIPWWSDTFLVSIVSSFCLLVKSGNPIVPLEHLTGSMLRRCKTVY